MTKTGPLSYRQLRELNSPNRTPEVEELLQAPSGTRADTYGMGKVSYTQPSDGFDDFGSSAYDSELVGYDELVNRQDVRADRQPWYAQIGAGLAKGTILAGTTFLDGTIGLLVGGAEAISRGDISGLWDNGFSRAMQAVNEWSEEALPNYYSYEEQNSPWYENIFTANFLGDKFIKNLGFSVGALYSGGVSSAGLKLTKLPQLIGAITKSAKAPAAVSTLVGATVSAVNEGRIEALNNSKDWQDLKIQELDDAWRERLDTKYATDMDLLRAEYQAALEEYEATKGTLQRVGGDQMGFVDPAYQRYQSKIAALDARRDMLQRGMESEWENRHSDESYRSVINKIEEDRLKMGNTDMLLNLPILTASNIVQFTKFYSNGFNTARRAGVRTVEDATEGAARYAGKSFSKGQAAWRVTKGALSEGTEEISQKAASLVAGDYYSTDVNNFYKSQIDHDAEQETLSWMKSFATGINETVNDASSWEEFFIGSFTGLLGVPSFRSMRNSDGSFRSPIELQGGAINEIREYNQEITRSQEVANYLNSRVQSPEFLNYYRGMIRHNKYQNDMNRAVEEDDEFNFKNAEHAQFVSDIVMFDNAGKLEDLRTYIDTAFDLSDENLQSIVENTTTTDENGKKIGPFVDSNGNPMYATEEGKQQMIDKLTQSRDTMIATLDNYRRTKNDLDIRTGGNLSNEQLAEMTWLKTQVDDWTKRASDMTPLIRRTLVDLSNNLENTLIRSLGDASMEEAVTAEESMENISKIANQLGIGTERIEQLSELSRLDDKRLSSILTSPKNEKFVEGLIEDISTFGSDIISALDKQNVVRLLKDLPKIGKGIETFNNKLEEYLANPEKQVAEQIAATESVRKEVQQRKSQTVRESLANATSLSEFREALAQEADFEVKESVLKDLESEGNQVAKNYDETEQYNRELKRALNELGETDQVSQDAMTLWQEQFNAAENLEQLANPNSIFINNEDAFIEDSEGVVDMAESRFQNARYVLQRAMSKVNNDIRFKDRFSDEYRNPVNEPVKGKGIDKDSTGDSGTSTVPYVNPNATPVETPSVPIGNVTAEMVAAENRDANRRVETQRSLDQSQQGQRRYYRPAVPELHIEASKEGDFRPFDVVVAEREPNVDFSGIYNYLRDNGAFSYVNAAKIKPGDTLGFMIDPDFNDHTIFLVDTRNNQIVGSIDESDASVARYEGLENLIKKVRDEFEGRNSWSEGDITTEVSSKDGVTVTKFNRHRSDGRIYTGGGISIDSSKITEDSIEDIEDIEDIDDIQLIELRESDGKYAGTIRAKVKDGGYTIFEVKFTSNPIEGATIKTQSVGKFFATPQVRVSKMMVGRIPYTSEERSLADIPGVIDGDTKPILGIIKNGVLTTNEKIDDRLIIKPVDMAQKEGRLYLLIPNAAGTYSPAAVRVKHFNNQEFNLDDVTVASTPIGRGINEALDRLADATSQDDVSVAMKELAQDIYMQDVMVTWFDAKAGSGIVISRKVRKPDGTYEMVNINGQEQIKEIKYTIYYQSSKRTIDINGLEYTYEAAKESGVDMSLFGQPREVSEIRRDILNTILGFNLPIQVSASRINDSGYNNRVIKSNVLTSNLREAKVIGSWFTTDYFDKQGNLQRSVSPSSVKPAPGRRTTTPVGGTEGVIQGTTVKVGKYNFTVDLKSMVYTDENGIKHSRTGSNANIFAMAWAQENFGDSTESSVMTENKVITPQGRVLDRNTGQYVSDAEGKRIKDKIAGINQAAQNRIAESKRVIADIYENQKKVDKTRTDSDYYYVLEDDGQYHEYSRVHSRPGDNWLGERTETENSRRALEAGTAVDKVIRDFFTSKETPVKPDTLSEAAFIDLISKLTEIKSKMEQLGETFMADNIVLFQKYADGTRVAGEVDILSVDKNGNFKIYDVKTSRYSFSDRYFTEKSSKQRMSTKDYYTLQLSAYQNLFESQYGVRPTRLAILPFVLTYDKNRVASITGEKGILIDYNPAVNVPLASVVQAPQQQDSLPIFDPTMETMITEPQEQNRVLPENAFEEGGEIGYYEKDGKLYTGYLKKIGEVEVTYGSGQKDMVPIHITKVRDRGFGRAGEFGSTSEYIVVFPNGYAMTVVNRSANDSEAFKLIMDALSAKPEKVLSLSNEKTQVYNPRMLEEIETELRNRQYSGTAQPSGAASTIQREDAINNHDEEFEELELSEREKSPINYRGQEFILEDIPSMTGKHRSRVKAYLRIGYSLEQISNMIGENLVEKAGARGRIWDSLSREQRVAIAREFNPAQTSFDSEYSEKGYSMNTEYQIEDIESLITSELYSSPLFQRVLAIARQFGITVQFRNRAMSDTAEGLYGYNRIAIQISPNSPYFEQVIMHELIHSVTQGLINREGTGELTPEQESAVKMLREVFESVQSKYGKDSWYGLSNLAEFVAELANPKFREFLKSQKVEEGTSLWNKVKSFFKRLFGNKLELSDATLERMLENPIKDSDKEGLFQKNRERAIFNRDLSQVEKLFIQDFILGLSTVDRLSGRANIYNPNTGYYYTVNFSPSIEGHLDNLKGGFDGFEVMDRRKGLKSSMTANWDRLDSNLQETLKTKGWTQEKFDSISQRERDQAVECLGL